MAVNQARVVELHQGDLGPIRIPRRGNGQHAEKQPQPPPAYPVEPVTRDVQVFEKLNGRAQLCLQLLIGICSYASPGEALSFLVVGLNIHQRISAPKEGQPKTTAKSTGTEVVVFMNRRDSVCAECGTELLSGGFLRMEGERPLCLECADLGHLEFLPSGNTALTRRASRHSPLRAVVVRWSRARQRYERRGIMVTPEALDQAEVECEADEQVRTQARIRAVIRREHLDAEYQAAVALRLKELFPGCPVKEAEAIAAWTCRKYSGRVGRSAAAKELDPAPLGLAVIAHIRHRHTPYDQELMSHGDRSLARSQVASTIDQVLARWE